MTKRDRENRLLYITKIMEYANAHGKILDILEGAAVADYIHRCETTLSRLACDACNCPKYDEVKQERTEKRVINYIADKIGCKARTQRDPRGACIRLYIKDDSTSLFFNSWDGETTVINW